MQASPVESRPLVRWRTALILGLVVGLFVLVDSFVRIARHPDANGPLQFSAEHGDIASSLVHGGGFSDPFGTPSGPTAWVPPFFALYLASVFTVFGIKTMASLKALLALDAVLAGLVTVASALLLDFAGLRQAKVLFTAVLLLLHLLNEQVLGLSFSTAWFVMAENAWLLTCACGAYYESKSGWRIGLALLCGIIPITHAGSGAACAAVVALFGIASFVRARRAGLPVPAGFRACFDYVAVPAVCFIFTVGLWTVRNYEVFGKFIPLKSAGWFEVYLTQEYTSDGVISDAVMVAHHPYTNPKLLVDYTVNGEQLFLREFKAKAKEAVAADPAKYRWGIVGRAENIFSYCDTVAPLRLCTIPIEPIDARKIVAADLAARLSQPVPIWWTSLDMPVSEFRTRLEALDIPNKGAIEADWLEAKSSVLESRSNPWRVLFGLSLAGIPTLAILVTIGLLRTRLSLALGAAWLSFVVAQMPNVLITHYTTHSMHFRSFHALAIACALTLLVEALRRRTRAGAAGL